MFVHTRLQLRAVGVRASLSLHLVLLLRQPLCLLARHPPPPPSFGGRVHGAILEFRLLGFQCCSLPALSLSPLQGPHKRKESYLASVLHQGFGERGGWLAHFLFFTPALLKCCSAHAGQQGARTNRGRASSPPLSPRCLVFANALKP